MNRYRNFVQAGALLPGNEIPGRQALKKGP